MRYASKTDSMLRRRAMHVFSAWVSHFDHEAVLDHRVHHRVQRASRMLMPVSAKVRARALGKSPQRSAGIALMHYDEDTSASRP